VREPWVELYSKEGSKTVHKITKKDVIPTFFGILDGEKEKVACDTTH
jgi:hypothetical protein